MVRLRRGVPSRIAQNGQGLQPSTDRRGMRRALSAWLVQAAVASWLLQAAAGLYHNTNCVLTLSGESNAGAIAIPSAYRHRYVGRCAEMGSNTPGPDLGTDANGTAVSVLGQTKFVCRL